MITGLLDHLQLHNPGSTLYGIQGGPKGIMEGIYKRLGPEEVAPFRNQVGISLLSYSRPKLQLLLSTGPLTLPLSATPDAHQLEEADADL